MVETSITSDLNYIGNASWADQKIDDLMQRKAHTLKYWSVILATDYGYCIKSHAVYLVYMVLNQCKWLIHV